MAWTKPKAQTMINIAFLSDSMMTAVYISYGMVRYIVFRRKPFPYRVPWIEAPMDGDLLDE